MPQHVCPVCATVFASFAKLSHHMDREHEAEYAAHGQAVLEHVAVQQAQKQARRAEDVALADQALELPQHPPLPRPYLSDIDPIVSFGNMRTFNVYSRMEKHSCSLEAAREWMAEQQVDTLGAVEPLLLDPKKGLGPPRAILDGITASLGLKFRPRTLELSIGTEEPVQVVMHARDIEASPNPNPDPDPNPNPRTRTRTRTIMLVVGGGPAHVSVRAA